MYCFVGFLLMPPGPWYREVGTATLFVLCGHFWTGSHIAKAEENAQEDDVD